MLDEAATAGGDHGGSADEVPRAAGPGAVAPVEVVVLDIGLPDRDERGVCQGGVG